MTSWAQVSFSKDDGDGGGDDYDGGGDDYDYDYDDDADYDYDDDDDDGGDTDEFLDILLQLRLTFPLNFLFFQTAPSPASCKVNGLKTSG